MMEACECHINLASLSISISLLYGYIFYVHSQQWLVYGILLGKKNMFKKI